MSLLHFFIVILLAAPLYAQKLDKEALLDSYIPASMQIIAHITELMKFDLKPSSPSLTTTPMTPTVMPTRPHKPGIFAPPKKITYEEYLHRLTGSYEGDYFDRYYARSLGDDLTLLWSKELIDLIHHINTVEQFNDNNNNNDIDNDHKKIGEFLKIFDDTEFGKYLIKMEPHKPPIKAYVGLLSLYDLLNKESKVLGLNKYTGYSKDILTKLVDLSAGTSANQLKYVLEQISKRKDTKNESILRRINELTKDLGDNLSYISTALINIPPLVFSH